VKSIKRAMAGEYSRELSVKSFVGQARMVRLGFRSGASPGYGTRRLLLDQSRASKFVLAPGERQVLSPNPRKPLLTPQSALSGVSLKR